MIDAKSAEERLSLLRASAMRLLPPLSAPIGMQGGEKWLKKPAGRCSN